VRVYPGAQEVFEMAYTVGDVAEMAHVSVRALHHYDEIGLLEPSGRTEAGYRLYEDHDLERLQQIMLFKELGFELSRIAEIMDDPAFDRRAALLGQRDLLQARIARLSAMVRAVDDTLLHEERGTTMSKDEMFEVFGDFDPAEHEAETEERWGETDAYRESARRTSSYTKQDWERYKAETDAINEALAALMDEGVAPDDARAVEAVERARVQIDTWFYPCSRRMHAELGRMYVADPRFQETFEKIRPGMAQYVCDAAEANASRGEP
jgi:DNA-binding transcriptional MerR regulator